jgi:hypothetical protein
MAKKTTTIEIGRNDVNAGLRIGVENGRTGRAMAEQSLAEAFAERDALLASASGDIQRQMVRDAAAPIIEQRQLAVSATDRMLMNREERLRQAEVDAARSGDAVHVRFAELVRDKLRVLVAGIPDYLGDVTVFPVSATRDRYTYAGKVRVTAIGSGVSAVTWRAVMAWSLGGFGDQLGHFSHGIDHLPAQVTYPAEFVVELDGLAFIDRDAARSDDERAEQEYALMKQLRKVGPGQAAHVDAVVASFGGFGIDE